MTIHLPIFISYRRDAAGGHAGRLHDSLARRLHPRLVFIDQRRIQPGTAFPEVLREALQKAGAMVAIVAPGWADSPGPSSSAPTRLWNPGDWVRIEIETALQRGIPLLPVLVGRAQMPRLDALPPSLQAFGRLQALDLRDETWDHDVDRALQALGVQQLGWAGLPASSRWLLGLMGILLVALAVASVALSWVAEPSTPPREDPYRLTSLTPTEQQIELLASSASLNVPIMLRFLALARDQGIAASDLHAHFERWKALVWDLRGTHHATLTRHADAALQEADARVQRGDLDGALTILSDAHVLSQRTTRTAQERVSLALLQQRRGLLLAVLGRTQEAVDMLRGLADGDLPDAAWYGSRAASTAARLELRRGHVDEALRLLKRSDALFAAVESSLFQQARHLDQHAALLEDAGQAAAALEWRRRAEALYDRHGDPGHAFARDNARALAAALDHAGLTAEAAAVRSRYSLAQPATTPSN